MLVWYAAGAVAIVWAVFQSPAVDYRMVALGAVLGVVDRPLGTGLLHTLAAPVLALGVVMAATVGRRLVRRRWLGVPIGMFLFVVLSGAWTDTEVFWWPVGGLALPEAPEVPAWPLALVLEVVGVGIAVWLYRRFGLDDPDRRDRFVRTGQLDRGYMS